MGAEGGERPARGPRASAFDRASIGMAVVDLEGRFRQVNPAFCAMLGYEEAELVGRPFHDVTHPDDVALGVEEMRRVISGELPAGRIEKRYIRKGGDEVWTLLQFSLVRDSEGRSLEFLSQVIDVSELKRAQAELERRERVFRLIADHVDEMLWLASSEPFGEVIYVSSGFERIWGVDPGPASEVHRIWVDSLLPDDRDRALGALDAFFREGGEYDSTYRIRRADGQVRWIHARGCRVPGPSSGGLHMTVGVARDVTDERRLAELVRVERDQLASVLDAVPVSIYLQSPDHTIPFANRTFREAFGDPGERRCHGLFHGRDAPCDPRPTFRAFEHGGQEAWEWTPGDGRAFWIHDSPITGPDGSPSVLETCIDITELRRVEEERRDLESQLEHSRRLESLGRLAGGIAHDFNNLLVGILGNADLALRDLPEDSSTRGCLERIVTAGQAASGLCTQMLAFAGKGAFAMETLDLRAVVEESLGLLRSGLPSRIPLEHRAAPEPVPVVGDISQLRQILVNLVTNAAEAIGDRPGRIRVATSVESVDADRLAASQLDDGLPAGAYAVLEVSDDGCGMGEEERKRLFEPFYSSKATGRGLGLASVLGGVRRHSGAVEVDSDTGSGTRITVLLPAAGAETLPTGRVDPEVAREPARWSGRVLLVDDDPAVRTVARGMLETCGLDVLTAPDGREAVRIFERHSRELRCVVLDLTMPGMDGSESLARLREIDGSVPVLIATGYSVEHASAHPDHLDPEGWIQKPYTLEELREKLAGVLRS